MKVMKFGGTSVGSVKSILSLKEIVEARGIRRDGPTPPLDDRHYHPGHQQARRLN